LASVPGPRSIATVATGTGANGTSWAGSYDNYLFNVILANNPVPINLGSGTLDVACPPLGEGRRRRFMCTSRKLASLRRSPLKFPEHAQREELAERLERG